MTDIQRFADTHAVNNKNLALVAKDQRLEPNVRCALTTILTCGAVTWKTGEVKASCASQMTAWLVKFYPYISKATARRYLAQYRKLGLFDVADDGYTLLRFRPDQLLSNEDSLAEREAQAEAKKARRAKAKGEAAVDTHPDTSREWDERIEQSQPPPPVQPAQPPQELTEEERGRQLAAELTRPAFADLPDEIERFHARIREKRARIAERMSK